METNHRKTRTEARQAKSIDFARLQRATANEFAHTMWQMLRAKRCGGTKFREYPIPPYCVDFCCVELKLVIEVDGEHHLTEEGRDHDRVRDRFLRKQGFEVLRFPGFKVLNETDPVLSEIRNTIQHRRETPSPPAPLPQRGEGSTVV